MLGVAPTPPPANVKGPAPGEEPPNPPNADFQPFAPVPGTLAGLTPSEQQEQQPEETGVEPSPQTLAGLTDPSRAPQQHPGRTLMGFGAWPSPVESATPPLATAPANVPTTDTSQPSMAEAGPLGGAKPAAHATLMGVSPLVAPGAAEATEARPAVAQFKGTLLGVSPFGDPRMPPAGPSPNASELGATLPIPGAVPTVPGRPQPLAHATMLGMAPVPNAVAQAVAPSKNAEFRDFGNMAVPHGSPAHKGTLLGVAMPGIAPMQPGQAKPGGPSPVTPPVSIQTTDAPEPRRLTSDYDGAREVAERARAERAVQTRRLAWVFGTAAMLLVVLIVVALGVWWTSVHLAVSVTTGESGNENLVLTCSNCPDGTRATIESKTTTFKSGRATIELLRRLSIGDNELTLQVVRPSRTRGETVTVTVPVEFRVTSSVAELAADPPAVSVQCDAAPGTRLAVDGQVSAVGANGQLKVPLDVSAMLTGQAGTVLPFERRIAYEVTREGRLSKGTLVVRSGITPLELTTPGSMYVTQNATFTLSGHTSAKARLTANGHNIAVAADGTFLQEMALSAPGATKLYLRAQEANLAPRLVEISLERVTNLRQRADELARPLPTDFDAISALAVTKPDSLVALHA
jgi:hypothetical protein